MAIKKPKTNSATSSFGVSRREGHDATRFYQSRLYAGQPPGKTAVWQENPIPPEYLNRLFCQSSERMDELPDNSVHLMVTSPPYNARKDYDQDLSLEEYRALLRRVLRETYRVLVVGGRVCFNIANLGRKPYIPLHAYIIQDMRELGFLMRGEIIWNKAASAGTSTAWGSWQSAVNPTLRDVHEYILVFSKGDFARPRSAEKSSTISREEFLEFTKSIWTFGAESARRVRHPAPFPVELPYRCIQLYTFAGEVVLDPFVGSGTTCLAALKTNRNYVGYDISPEYLALAESRLKQATAQLPLFGSERR
jgi:DNA modification methylase